MDSNNSTENNIRKNLNIAADDEKIIKYMPADPSKFKGDSCEKIEKVNLLVALLETMVQ